MNILNLENISKTYMEKAVLDNVCIGIDDSDKIGVVGANGTGKSTLLAITAGNVEPDEGRVVMGNDVRISYLPQNPQFDMNKTLLENITEAIYAGNDHWDKMGEIKANLAKLGIDDPECNPEVLSGGQRKRAALVSAIMTPADLLILDEPTNHLDSEMIEWLESFLRRYNGAILMVTHDRYFLDEVTDQIIEIDKGNAYRYEANYSGYLELKEQRLDYEKAAERKAATLYKKDLAWIRRGARARSTKQKAHIKRFEELRDRKRPEEERFVELSSLPSRMGNKTIILDGISKGYGDKTLFKDFTYTFNKLDRIGIIGPNGCGKSTLLKCIIGDVALDSGSIEIGQTIEIGYFGQENEFERQSGNNTFEDRKHNGVISGDDKSILYQNASVSNVEDAYKNTMAKMSKAWDGNMRVIDYVKETAEYIETTDGTVSASSMCERFLFNADMQYAPLKKLSGGEKRRLYLLKVLMSAPNVIILDEPTNDLDIQTLRILEDYLDSFAGIVITVSHDRYFLDRVVTRIFSFEPDGILRQSEGGYSDYLEHRKQMDNLDGSDGNKTISRDNKTSKANKTSKDNKTKNGADGNHNSQNNESDSVSKKNKKYRAPREKTKLSFNEQKEYDTIESEIESMEMRSSELDDLIAEAATDFVKLTELTKEKEELELQIEQKLDRFVELQEMVDKFNSQG
ncbi:MAG: ABC-F family ATP-binding cassette domain-containing protein [Lachnospiraceae bacterium]|nr:ABC-F family ATP-binding cassette domain-containing protein [Lachnospiraceae bacterium]